MSRRKREFNVWAAYVDMFSNLMAMLLMVGLVATAAGGSMAGAQPACSSLADRESRHYMDRLMDRFAGREAPMSTDCTQELVPQNGQIESGRVAFVQFPRGGVQPCWKTWGDGCPEFAKRKRANRQALDRMRSQMDDTCDDIERVLIRNVRQMAVDRSQPEIRFSIVGHASEEWSQSRKYCPDEYSQMHKDGVNTDKDKLDARLICNYKLSLDRAVYFVNYCIGRWGQNEYARHLSETDRSVLAKKMIPSGESFLDDKVKKAFPAPAAQRRVTISFHTPGLAR